LRNIFFNQLAVHTQNAENGITDQRIAVITGANSKMGKAAAFQLCEFERQLILISRNVLKGRADK